MTAGQSRDDFGARRLIGLFAGMILFVLILAIPGPAGLPPKAKSMAAVLALMATWWMTEAVHISVTALVPVAAYPLLGIMASSEVAPHYANHLIFLYIGGFVLALAMEKWNLHRRVALATISRIGTNPTRLVLGFMVATAGISMWVSNTATTLLMYPVAMAVALQVAESALIDGKSDAFTAARIKNTFGGVLMLAVAYSASIGRSFSRLRGGKVPGQAAYHVPGVVPGGGSRRGGISFPSHGSISPGLAAKSPSAESGSRPRIW